MSDLKDLISKIKKFRDERNWMQYHNPKDMAISISLEASELLEHFQWKNQEEIQKHIKKYKQEISDEIADIAIYLFELADNLNVDLTKAMERKLVKNAKKYPVKKARNKHLKYNKL